MIARAAALPPFALGEVIARTPAGPGIVFGRLRPCVFGFVSSGLRDATGRLGLGSFGRRGKDRAKTAPHFLRDATGRLGLGSFGRRGKDRAKTAPHFLRDATGRLGLGSFGRRGMLSAAIPGPAFVFTQWVLR